MYYYPQLGKNGRLGNQMFQYATVYSLAKMNSSKAVFPTHTVSSDGNYSHIHLYDAFPGLTAEKLPIDRMLSTKYSYRAKEGTDFNFESGLFASREDCSIDGYFQSEKYFEMYSEDIKREFTFKEEIETHTTEIYNQLKAQSPNSHLCAVHFRRGDYTKLGHVHTNLGSEYYNPAFSWMMANMPNCKFVAFSDDIEWCKKNLPQGFLFSEAPDMFHDMLLMSMCDSHIIANSSFSWWGAWLSKNTKQVIAPKNWFGPEGPKKWDTIYCKKWGVI